MMLTNFITALLTFAALLPLPQTQNDIPQYSHVVVVIEENHAYNQLIGSANAPYLNELAQGGVLFTNSHGIGHPSQPNYLALFSGSTQSIPDDQCLESKTPFHTPNLGAALLDNKLTFTGYAQTMPKAGFMDCIYLKSTMTMGSLYTRKHSPWVDWVGTGVNCIPASASVPMTEFPKDFNKLPTVAFVIPDGDYDMHNIGAPGDAAAIKRGDTWLKENIARYAAWARRHNSLLIITFDEDNSIPGNQNKIPTIFYGAKLPAGKYDGLINHYNVLHTLESMYGLPVTDNEVAPPISGIWGK